MNKIEELASLALPEELEVREIKVIDDILTITALSTRKCPCCPLCGTPAERFHSHYTFTHSHPPLATLPICKIYFY
jgi:hypothetical protein